MGISKRKMVKKNNNKTNKNSQPEKEPTLKTLSKKKEKRGSRMINKAPEQIKDKQKYKNNNNNNSNFNSNNKNKRNKKFNNKKEENVFNDEIEISDKPTDNFFDFDNNQNVFTKLKNTDLENLKEERKNIQKKAKEEFGKKIK